MLKLNKSSILLRYKNITHTFTSRYGGHSTHNFKSLNLAFHVGDQEESVLQNHSLLAKELSYNTSSLVHMKQIHSNDVHIVDTHDTFNKPPSCDALITNIKNKPLMVMVADCSPILFYDSKKEVIAVAHAGRQGAFLNIIHNTLDSFKNEFNSHMEDIIVNIGPAICQNCYEVGEEIAKEAKLLQLGFAVKQKGDSFYLDIRKILKKQLLVCGIQENNIEISQDCSSCKKEKYFSYRAEGSTGRFAGIIKLN